MNITKGQMSCRQVDNSEIDDERISCLVSITIKIFLWWQWGLCKSRKNKSVADTMTNPISPSDTYGQRYLIYNILEMYNFDALKSDNSQHPITSQWIRYTIGINLCRLRKDNVEKERPTNYSNSQYKFHFISLSNRVYITLHSTSVAIHIYLQLKALIAMYIWLLNMYISPTFVPCYTATVFTSTDINDSHFNPQLNIVAVQQWPFLFQI